MEKHQGSFKLGLMITILIVGIVVLALGCFIFTHKKEGKREQRAGEVYIIGDEIVYEGYIGSGEGL